MAYFLIKTEPATWSWQDQEQHQRTHWDGVRNYQAAGHLKAMSEGDLCLFYHSGEERQIMGVVRVVTTYYPDPSDETGRFGMVDVVYERPFARPVSLKEIKAQEALQHLALVRQSRLSVMPVDEASWQLLCQIGGMV